MRFILPIISISVVMQGAEIDAGSITKDIEKKLEQKTSPKFIAPQKKDSQEDESKISSPSTVKVLVKSFKITGNTVISSEEIQNILSKYVDRTLTLTELKDCSRLIVDFYISKGFTARSFLPPQEVKDGIIEIAVLEGKLSNIEIDSIMSQRLKPEIAKGIIEKSHPVGEVLEIEKLEKGLLLLSDNPGIMQTSALSAGANPGDSKLKIKLEDTSLFNSILTGSNYGSKATGSNQISLASSINSPLSIGDQIIFQAMKTEGIDYGRLGYSLPLDYSGLKVGINASKMNYETVKGIDADGSSKSVGLELSYPIIRTSNNNLTFSISYDEKDYFNRSTGTVISDKTNNPITTSLNGNIYDSEGYFTYGISFTRGNLDLSSLESDYQADYQTAQTNGLYSKTALNLSRTQYLTDSLFLGLGTLFQQSNKNLDSSERLYLGGVSGIRAYPSNEAAGDEGYILTTELTKNLPYGFNTSLFYDFGHIKQHENLYSGWQGAGIEDNYYSLKGYGASLGFSYDSWSAKATVAYKDGKNPNPQVDGTDNDGTNKDPRFWFNISKAF